MIRTAESVVLTDCPPGPGGAVDVDLQVVLVDLDLDLLRLRQHRDRRGRGVDAALGLGLGHPLHPVRPALVLEDRVGALALDREGDLLEAADLGRRLRERLGREPPLLRVAGQHLVEVAGEERRLVAPGPGADLDEDVLVVVGVALDHRQPDLLFELLEPRRRLLDDLAQLGILAVLASSSRAPSRSSCSVRYSARQLVRRLQLAVLPPHLGVALPVADHRGIGHLALELGEARLDLLDERRSWNNIRAGRRATCSLCDDLDRRLARADFSSASTFSSAAIATASCSSSGSRVVRFCSIRPGHITARTQRLRRFLPAHLITS